MLNLPSTPYTNTMELDLYSTQLDDWMETLDKDPQYGMPPVFPFQTWLAAAFEI